MPRIPFGKKRFEVYMPTGLAKRLEEHLKGHPDGTIPMGDVTRYFVERTSEHLNRSHLKLGKYPGFAANVSVTGSEVTIRELERILESLSGSDVTDGSH
jgi:hypothetical protein